MYKFVVDVHKSLRVECLETFCWKYLACIHTGKMKVCDWRLCLSPAHCYMLGEILPSRNAKRTNAVGLFVGVLLGYFTMF